MPQPKTRILFLFLSSLALLANAEDLDETIVGCEAVGCPMDDSEPHCTLTNYTYEDIGLARIPDVPDSLENFSILKGLYTSGAGADLFTSIFYLGTPQDVSLDGVSGCAVLFLDPPQDTFEQGGAHTCSEVISQDCIDAIQDRAAKIAEGDSDDLCKAIQEDLEDNDIDECKDFTGAGKGVGRVFSRSLSTLGNIEGTRNSTSDCWPILPKSANLAELFGEYFDYDGGLNASTSDFERNRVSPVLTVFIKSDSNESVVDETVSRLTCLAINAVSEDDADNSAPRLAINTFLVGVAFSLFMSML
ncbi:hypothetical protein G7Z17_g1049 [Cylindrodendrum hubeiense]|uniref:Uncharacterized protein n=1 Tax=Cylindrodendrum hubeiense TaxID=595255 RepID=A0A9P5LFQ9_9HYPO|nr:hypothetical protein G7Z17_g1049 [Cylindrodendrum hubeiense]